MLGPWKMRKEQLPASRRHARREGDEMGIRKRELGGGRIREKFRFLLLQLFTKEHIDNIVLGFESERDANRPIKTISILIFLDYAYNGRYFLDQSNSHSCIQ